MTTRLRVPTISAIGKGLLCAMIAGVSAALVCTAAGAMVRIYETGMWPETWPEGLERFRDRARTNVITSGTRAVTFEIAFNHRRVFESAWADLMSLRTEGSPIYLENAKFIYINKDLPASGGVVRILTCMGGVVEEFEGEEHRLADLIADPGAHGFDSVPEYVVFDSTTGRWIAWHETLRDELDYVVRYRARTDIAIGVDGKVIRLDDLQFPADAELIDRRNASR